MTLRVWDRYTSESLALGCQDARGRLFISSLGQQNLVDVNFLHEGVDTIRQLYEGVIKADVLEQIKRVYDLGPTHRLINVLGRDWLLGSGGSSGFRYRLQDGDTGIILFICSRYALESTKHSHLKIELSPHFIDSRSVSMIQGYINNLASRLLVDPAPLGCAVHIAVDIQGWKPAKNFSDLLVTRARRVVDHRAISDVEFRLSEIATIYGNSQSFLFGTASNLQFSLYRKDLQAKSIDKVHFWESVWNRRTDENLKPIYDPAKPVWRFEFRFHHTVIKEFSESVKRPLLSFSDLVPHLTGLFHHALGDFRLNAVSSLSSSKSSFYRGIYIDPVWQLLLEDVNIGKPKADLNYERKRKKPGRSGLRNLWNSVGNLTSIYASKGFTPWQSVKYLKNSGIWEDQLAYYRNKMPDIAHLRDKAIERIILKDMEVKLKERTLRGVAV
jgi:hypothetical protein